MRFRKPFRLLAAVSVLAWPAAVAAYVGLAFGHTLTPAAPAATLLLLLGVASTSTICSMLVRLVPSAVAAWTMGYIEGREDGPERATEGATLLRLVND